jgi:hypothetical protein
VKYNVDPRLWVVLVVNSDELRFWLKVEVWDTMDPIVRTATVERLCKDKKEFGLTVWSLTPTSRWNGLASLKFAEIPEGGDFEIEKVLEGFLKKLGELEAKLSGVPDALRPIFDAWRASQPASAQR